MPTIKPIGYSPDTLVRGTTQFGNLAVASSNQDYGSSPDGVLFWATTDLDTAYNITAENPACDTPNNAGQPCCLSFYSTETKDETEFINLARAITRQSFTSDTEAYSWLTNNGYWTSYKPSTAIYYEIVDGKFIRSEYSPLSDTIWTTNFVSGQLTVYEGPNFDTTVNIDLTGPADAIGDLVYGSDVDRIFGTYINFGTMQMYSPVDNHIIDTITVGDDGNARRDMVYNTNDSTVWMVAPNEDKVYVVSATTTSLNLITGVTLTNFTAAANSLTWNSNRNLIYVGGGHEIDIVDCQTNTKINEINNIGDTGYSIMLDGMVYDPIHDRVYFSMVNITAQELRVYYLNCSTNIISGIIHTETSISSNTCMEYDPNGYVWVGAGNSIFVISTYDNSVITSESLTGLSTDIIFKSSKNQMICARGSVYNAVIYDISTVY